jgi:hypothetical protein
MGSLFCILTREPPSQSVLFTEMMYQPEEEVESRCCLQIQFPVSSDVMCQLLSYTVARLLQVLTHSLSMPYGHTT